MRQVEPLGIEVVRFAAVDGQLLPENEVVRLGDFAEDRRQLTRGEIGCTLSHQQVWRMIAEGDDEWAFVAEDDIHFSRDARDFLTSDMWIPAGAELIKADTNQRRQVFSHRVYGRPAGHELRKLLSDHDGSGGYFVSRRGAANLLAATVGRAAPVDWLLFICSQPKYHDIQVLQLLPAICIQDVFKEPHADSDALASVIEREASRTPPPPEKVPRTPAGKLWREARRIGGQAVKLSRRLKAFVRREYVVRAVKFGPS